MLLSVIIPVYNSAPYLRRCVASVQNQTYNNLEIILVDDGSTDGSGILCDEIANDANDADDANGGRIKVIHKPNGGSSSARNEGLRVATGEYVVFMDSDDVWLINEGIEQMMRRLEERDDDILLFKRVDIYPDREILESDYDVDFIRSHSATEVFEELVKSGRLSLSACFQLVRRSIIIDNKIEFPIGILSGEDTHFSCLVWRKVQSADAMNLEMYGYCHRSNSVTTSYSIRNLRSYDELFTYWKQQIANMCINYRAIGMLLANMYVSACYDYFSIAYKDRKHAWQILLKHQQLLHFATSKKSLRMRKVADCIGVKPSILIFATYGKLKKIYQSIAL